MDPLLTTLKFLGILASGILGIIAALTQTHEQVGPGGRKKLNRWGKWAFALTICGLAGALAAQFAETVKRRLEDRESRQRTEQQIRQANQLLAELQGQAQQSGTILQNVEQQGLIAKMSLEALKLQSEQGRALLTNVEAQGVLAGKSLSACLENGRNLR